MTAKEQAYSIINSLSEEQLNGFIAMFRAFINTSSEHPDKMSTYRSLTGMLHPIPDLDYEKELEEYRKERYEK